MSREPVTEAKLVETESGLAPEGPGWFVVNMAEAASMGIDDGLYGFGLESPDARWEQLGVNVLVISPGRASSMYHAEPGQEDFLVLDGECRLIVEGSERELRRWDFVHCPPNTAHTFVGAGSRPCVVLMMGVRNAGRDLLFPVDETAARYGASVAEETGDPQQAYAGWSALERRRWEWPLE